MGIYGCKTPKRTMFFCEEKMRSVAERRQTVAFLKFQMAALCRDAATLSMIFSLRLSPESRQPVW